MKKLFGIPCDENLIMSLTLGIGVWLIYLAFLPPAIYTVDGNSMLAVAESLVINHDFSVPSWLGLPGRNGQIYSIWYPLLSILAVPFVAIGLAIGSLFDLPAHYIAAVCALVVPALLTAATASFVALLALRLGSTRGGACLAALSFAFGTIALAYTRTFFAEPLLAFLTIASLYFALKESKRGIIIAAAFACLAVLAKPTGIIVGAVLSGYLLVKRRQFLVVFLPSIGTMIGLVLYGAYNYARFENPLSFGPSLALFDATFIPEGIAGLLVSPGRGLLWYCPPVILSILGIWNAVKSNRLEVAAIVTLFCGYLLVYSSRIEFGVGNWSGGWAWGPRYLFPAIPLLLALTGLAEKWRKGLVFLAVVGFIVSAPTLVSFYQRYYAEANEQGISQQLLFWSPTHTPIMHIWGSSYRQIRDALESDVTELVNQAGKQDTTIANSQMLRVVAVWWWMLPAAGIPRWIGVIFAIFLVGMGIWMILKALSFTENWKRGNSAE